jgi:hypothetical protein
MGVVSAVPQLAMSQVAKTFQGMNPMGQTVDRPYLTHSEFQSATVTGGKHAKGRGRSVPFGKISTIASLDSLAQYLGPSVEKSEDSPFSTSVLAYVNYKGLELEYVKAQGADFKLRELKITSTDWAVTVNGTELRPGTDANVLDKSVRRAGHIFIAAPGAGQKAKSHGKLDVMGEDSSIQIDFDEKAQQIKDIRFH